MQYSREDVGITEYGWLDCKHRREEIRRRVLRNGAVVFTRQCLVCGENRGAVAKTSQAVLCLATMREYDESLRELWIEASQEHRQAQQEYEARLREAQYTASNKEWWDRYTAYLATPAWKRKSALVLDRAGGICECCGITRAAQAHHLTYEHMGDEYLWELKAICINCHQKIHPDKGIRS